MTEEQGYPAEKEYPVFPELEVEQGSETQLTESL